MDSLLEALKKKAAQAFKSTKTAVKQNIQLKPGTSAYSMTQPVRDLAPKVASFPLYKPAVESGKQLLSAAKKELYTPSKTIVGFTKNVAPPLAKTAAYTYGAASSTPTTIASAAGIGGGFNTVADLVTNRKKAQPVKSFVEGSIGGVEATPKLSLLSKFTNPTIDKFASSIAARYTSPVAKQVASRTATGLANIPEGVLMKKSLTPDAYNLSDAAMDFVTGAAYGSPRAKLADSISNTKAKAKGVAVYRDDVQHVKESLDYLSSKGQKTKPQLDILRRLEKDAEVYKQKLKLVDNFEGGRDAKAWKAMSLEDKYKMIASKLQDSYYTPKDQGGAGMVMSLTDQKLYKSGEIPPPPKQGSGEQVLEAGLGFKPGMKREFDLAMLTKDKAKVAALLPEVPEAYKAKFKSDIDTIMGKPSLRKNVPRRSFTNIRELDNPLLYKKGTPQTPNEVIGSTDDYIKDLIGRQKDARGPTGPKSLVEKGRSFLREVKEKFVDSTAPIEDAVSAAEKQGKFKVLPKSDVRLQIDRVLRSKTLASQFAEDNGMVDVIRQAPDLDYLNQYMIAKQARDISAKGTITGRDLAKDNKLIKDLGATYEPFAQQVNQYSRKLLQYSVDSGLIDKKMADELIKKYPNYVPINRIFSELEQGTMPKVGTRAVASLSRQSVVQKLKGSEREISNPIESLLLKTQDAFNQGERNKAASMLAKYKDLPDNPMQIKPLRTAENVLKRIDIYKEAGELGTEQRELTRLMATRNKWARILQSELNKLNKEGIDQYLKRPSIESPIQRPMVSKILTKITPEQIKENAPKTIDELSNSYLVKSLLAKEYGLGKNGMDKLAADVFNGGYDQLLTLNPEMNFNTAKSIVNQIFKDPTIIPESKIIKDIPLSLSSKETRDLVNNLVNEPPDKISAIKSKIATRDKKLTSVLDTVEVLRSKVSDIKDKRNSLFDEARLIKDAESRGKKTISVLKNGIKEIYETTPEIAAAAKSLNQEQMGIVAKVFSIPTRVLQLGATGLNIPFVVTNIVKDQITGFINSNRAAKTSLGNPINFLKALHSAIGHDDMYDEMVRNAGGGTSFDIARQKPDLTVERIRAGKDLTSKIKYTVKHPLELLDAIENIVGRGEEVTRIQNYRGAKEAFLSEGRTTQDSTLLAAQAARENTANFARKGSFGRALNWVIPFFNAGIQGARQLNRSFQNNPKATGAKLAVGLFMPVTAATVWNMSDPKRLEVYNDIQDYEKEGNLIIIPENPTKDEQGRWNVIKIPIPPGLSNLTTLVRRPLEQSYGGNAVKLQEIAANLFTAGTSVDVTSPNRMISSFTPQLVKPAIETTLNKNLFTGRDIVPQSMKNLPPEMQVRDYTAPGAKALGNATGVSPLIIENAATTVGGGLGAQLIGKESPVENLQRRFSKATGGVADNEIYQAEQEASGYNAVKKRVLDSYFAGDIETAKQIATENNIALTQKDAKEYKKTLSNDVLDMYINGDMEKAKEQALKYNLSLTQKDLKKRAKSRAVSLYKKAKTLDNQVLMKEAERIAKKYGLIITRKDVE